MSKANLSGALQRYARLSGAARSVAVSLLETGKLPAGFDHAPSIRAACAFLTSPEVAAVCPEANEVVRAAMRDREVVLALIG